MRPKASQTSRYRVSPMGRKRQRPLRNGGVNDAPGDDGWDDEDFWPRRVWIETEKDEFRPDECDRRPRHKAGEPVWYTIGQGLFDQMPKEFCQHLDLE